VWISTPYRYLDADLHSLPARGNEYDERKRTERESPQPRRKEGYLDLDRGRGGSGSGVQVWEGRLSSGTRVGLVSASSPAAAVIAGGPKYLAVPACAPTTGVDNALLHVGKRREKRRCERPSPSTAIQNIRHIYF